MRQEKKRDMWSRLLGLRAYGDFRESRAANYVALWGNARARGEIQTVRAALSIHSDAMQMMQTQLGRLFGVEPL